MSDPKIHSWEVPVADDATARLGMIRAMAEAALVAPVGEDGPVVAGSYGNYETAILARSGMTRTWRMILSRQQYWVVPVERRGTPDE